VRPFFEEDGIALHACTVPGRWLARGATFNGLASASIDRAAGEPVSQWSPITTAARPLHRLQNEMQMLLYTTQVNDERTARGALPINSFWLSGTGSLREDAPAEPQPGPTVDDSLRLAALHDDGPGWAEAWRALDAGAVAALLADCADGGDVSLTLCGDRGARRYTVQQRGMARWAKALFNRQRTATVLEAL
jgi:hypothetical protein